MAQRPRLPYQIDPLPAVGTMTGIQVALHDNGTKLSVNGRKTTTTRFKVTIEAYTSPKPINKRAYMFKRSLELRDPDTFTRLIDSQLQTGLIDQTYHTELTNTVASVTGSSEYLFGQVRFQNGKGWQYTPHQFVAIEYDGVQTPYGLVFIDGVHIALDQFSDFFAKESVIYSTWKEL
ncbi:protein of unknown function [Methylorubrum extorquens DM4]|uniref:Uncharacterized protein n=1 Tax=Methylorubrum extorquens (strain DSM 6343 / CIP 106787 / DM4) TaxID=661410 RepID=C7C8E8_METED|nr:hypothetical protein [Methylorubrum extorquens]CAX24215.1 protein of unknown function [Methylorubrum extorquens DM4]